MDIEMKKPGLALDRVVQVMTALADRSRLAILQALLEEPRCVEDLAGRLALSASTVSFHLKKLEGAGLVSKAREQYYSVYSAHREELGLSLLDLLAFEDPERATREARAKKMRQQVLRTFLRGGHLVRLPAQQQKRRILLEEMARAFEPGVQVAEKDVDRILHRFHEDHCMLRRLLVDEGFLARAGGIYWVIDRPVPGGAAGEQAGLPSPVARPAAPRPVRRKEPPTVDRKRALKQAYKEMVIPAGIFQIRNLRNGKILLGGTMNLNAAFNSARLQLNWGGHRNTALQKEWNQFGEASFEFSVLETITPPEDGRKITQDEVRDLAKQYVKKLAPFGDKGYHER